MRVKNRSASVVGYTVPDLNARRRFAPGEIKEIPDVEIEKLLYQPGGREMFLDNLQVGREEMAKLGFNVEPEYYYSEDDVKRIMLSGSLDEYLDMLDFAPEGILNLVKDLSIKLPLTDMNKIDGLKKKIGFDATAALKNQKEVEQSLNTPEKPAVQRRRTEVPAERRAEAPAQEKYKIIE